MVCYYFFHGCHRDIEKKQIYSVSLQVSVVPDRSYSSTTFELWAQILICQTSTGLHKIASNTFRSLWSTAETYMSKVISLIQRNKLSLCKEVWWLLLLVLFLLLLFPSSPHPPTFISSLFFFLKEKVTNIILI